MLSQIISAEDHILCPPLQDSLNFTWCLFVELYMCSNQLFNEVSLMTVMLCSNIREYQNIIWNKFMDTFFSDYVLFYPLSLTYPDSGPCPQAVSDLGTLSWYGS